MFRLLLDCERRVAEASATRELFRGAGVSAPPVLRFDATAALGSVRHRGLAQDETP